MEGERNQIRQDYVDSLRDLVDSSRPIITNLTIIAQENVAHADVIADVIERHLSGCPPAYKLPALYLLDSICKNIGSPYTRFFGANLFKTFTTAYTTVPEGTRRSLIHLFRTWTAPSPVTGAPLFPDDVIQRIDRFLRDAQDGRGPVPSGPAQGPPTQASLHNDIDKLLVLTRQRSAYDASDQDAQRQLAILNQLKHVVMTSTLPPEMLPSIKQQLEMFARKEQERMQGRQPYQQTQYRQFNGQGGNGQSGNGQFNGGGYQAPYGQPNQSSQPAAPFRGQGLGNTDLQAILRQVPSQTPQQGQMFAPAPASSNLVPASLLSSLTAAGLLGAETSRPATPTAEVELSSASLQKPRPYLIDRLYKNLPNQCSSCGKRYGTDQQKLMTGHLDWHFRVNKRLLDENRSQSRCWYLSAEQWIEFKEEDEIIGIVDHNINGGIEVFGSAETGPKKTKGSGGPAVEPIDTEKLSKKKVPVPADKKLASLPCPICQEKFTSVWDNDDEEWVWMNAVKLKGRIFHATCHAEAERSGSDLVKRILAPERVSTPPVAAVSAAPAPVTLPSAVDLASIIASVKRKVEDSLTDGPEIKREKVE